MRGNVAAIVLILAGSFMLLTNLGVIDISLRELLRIRQQLGDLVLETFALVVRQREVVGVCADAQHLVVAGFGRSERRGECGGGSQGEGSGQSILHLGVSPPCLYGVMSFLSKGWLVPILQGDSLTSTEGILFCEFR